MTIKETDVFILCGGLGKRLRPVVGEAQKVMAEVGGRPFLDGILEYLRAQGLTRVILGTGFQAEALERYYRKHNPGLKLDFSRETGPLGTGGAVKNAQGLIQSPVFFVLNGDSFCPLDYQNLLAFHLEKKALITIVVSRVPDARDFGSVEMAAGMRITGFKEKARAAGPAYVNAGVYCFSKDVFQLMPSGRPFSLEQEFFGAVLDQGVYGFESGGVFTDIGTPQRYLQAMKLLFKNNFKKGAQKSDQTQ